MRDATLSLDLGKGPQGVLPLPPVDLARAVDRQASLVARFEADGRTGTLNSYLVFRRRA